MRKLNLAEIDHLVVVLAEFFRLRAKILQEKGEWKWQRPVVSNNLMGKAVPREWYDFDREQVHITKPQKEMIRGRVRLEFGDFGRHGGKRAGAGRPKGRKVKSKSITMSNEAWAIIESIRGDETPSQFLQSLVEAFEIVGAATEPPDNNRNGES